MINREKAEGGGKVFEFAGFRLDATNNILSRDREPVKLTLKAAELLSFLVRNSNRVVSKDEILEAVWPESIVEEANLTVHIAALRKVLANGNWERDGGQAARIETFPKVGYRFVGRVNEFPHGDSGSSLVSVQAETPSYQDPVNIERKSKARRADIGRTVFMIASAALLIGLAGYLLSPWFRGRSKTEPIITPVPGLERSAAYAVSPNGEYVAHAPNIDGQFPLIITHLKSGSRLQLIPSGPDAYLDLDYSSDGNWLYFGRRNNSRTTLYKVPILGSTPIKLIDDVGVFFKVSPLNDSVCFTRVSDAETALIVSKMDGTEQRTIASRSASDPYSDFSFDWSPDGRMIASVAGGRIVLVDVATGKETILAELFPGGLGNGLTWLADGSALIASGSEKAGLPPQLWSIEYPSGAISRITNDLDSYAGASITSDGRTIISARYEDLSRLWILPSPFDSATPISTTYKHDFIWIRWGADGRIVFGSNASGQRDVWIMNRDGSDERQITQQAGNNVMPITSPDGRYLIFASNRAGEGNFNLWRVNIDGNDPRRLTAGQGANQPAISPDGRWVYYTSGKLDGPPEQRTIWRVSIDGEDEKPIIELPSYGVDVSPDGKSIALWFNPDPHDESRWKLAIFPAEGGDPIKLFDTPRGQRVKWTADGKGIAYVLTKKGVSNVWVQPIAGGPPRQVTTFTSDRILQFDWSPNNDIVSSRTERRSDVVMIRNFR
ncbi:MAG: winged helix-turn-helix domain-containing protein [Pyrinomonadaceae bacterium]